MVGLVLVAAGLISSSDVHFRNGVLRGEPEDGAFELLETEDCPVGRTGRELRVPARCEFLHGKFQDTEFGLHREREGSHIFLVMD